ncbi:PdaC/SigV domain-containing protein [Saccharibacillus kuerlensis]|uniref:Uncharacterized protein n=1 Tax=Saccharibacillus kuerlensis TaxID=459527 RepID=A0ABQ2L6K2_9BACL|nr:DUF4163 domain-containing protein [Saccharibacillus kuerlensis]GGO05086.1 hypothetical protein GCM10010969_31100 [Saccharibacillus kuerlensis]
MKFKTNKLHKTTQMMTAAVLTVGLLLPTAAVLETNGVQAAAAAATTQSAKTVKVTWNGKVLGVNAFQAKGDTYVPVKALAKAAGLPLTYDKTTGRYTLGTSPNSLVMSIYRGGVWIGANSVGLQSEGKVKGGTMYVPLSVLRDYASIESSWSAKTGTVALKPTAAAGVTVTQKSIKSTQKDAVVNIRYPQLSGSEAGIAKINAALKKHAEAFSANFEALMKEFGPLPSENMYYEADANFMVSYNKDGLFSVVMQDYSFYGGAHGSTIQTGYTFSLDSGKQVTLDQLLKGNPNYRSDIDKKIAAAFKKTDLAFDSNSFKTIGSTPNFYVRNSGITIFFQQYEYTAYAAGIPSFDFTFTSLLPKGTNPFAGL